MDVDGMLEGARDFITVKRVFGEPIERDGVVVIPAADVGGAGGAGGDAKGDGGGGFGVRSRPAGAFVIKHGVVAWQPAVNINRAIIGGQIVGIIALLVLRDLIGRKRRD